MNLMQVRLWEAEEQRESARKIIEEEILRRDAEIRMMAKCKWLIKNTVIGQVGLHHNIENIGKELWSDSGAADVSSYEAGPYGDIFILYMRKEP